MYCQFATEERIKRVRSFRPAWSFYICATARMDGKRMRNANFLPSPPEGRGMRFLLERPKMYKLQPPASLLAEIWNERTHPL